MEDLKIPEGHQRIMPYLVVKSAAGFLEFTNNVFDAEERSKMMRDDGTLIMHAEINIGGCTIMCADSTDKIEPNTAGLFIYVKDADETYKKSLSEGATSIMEPADQPYGRSCGVTDAFGNVWWITAV